MNYQIMYSSEATKPMSLGELEQLLAAARKKNENLSITGALIYIDGVFIQILEGNKEAVLNLMNTIETDPRHKSVKVFLQANADTRIFTDWRMAHVDINLEQMANWYSLEGSVSTDTLLKDIENRPSTLTNHVKNILTTIS